MPDRPASPIRYLTPLGIFFILLCIISIVEGSLMVLLPRFIEHIDHFPGNQLDTFLLALFSAPFLWLLVVHPLRQMTLDEIRLTRAMLGSIVDAVIQFDATGIITSANLAARQMFGYESETLLAQHILQVLPEIQYDVLPTVDGSLPPDSTPLLSRNIYSIGLKKNGAQFPVEFSVSPMRLGRRWTSFAIVHDITERKQCEIQLEYQSTHDELTHLPNRNLLHDLLNQTLLLSQRNMQDVVIFLLDLDHFKIINDSLGHDFGDKLLQIMAERLTECVRSGDTVARHGGDEFVIVVANFNVAKRAAQIATNLGQAVSTPLHLDGHDLVVTCSIGISIFPSDGDNPSSLLKNADSAMYRAKELGRDNLQFYAEEMNTKNLARMTMEKHLRRALERGEFSLRYQPKVNLSSGQITSMEALIRWDCPELGRVSPTRFIPMAEETNLIESIGTWVLHTACTQNKAWQAAGLPPLPVAVNLSARQFLRSDISKLIRVVLEETGLDPHFLELEITESLVMHDLSAAITTLRACKRLGVILTMDDFGTGYSSLSFLASLPFDKLKVDQSFVRDITSNPNSATIARTIIAMAHSLHLRVIAEGVETFGQLQYLRRLNCEEMQGFYFSRPVKAEVFEELLRADRQIPLSSFSNGQANRTLLVVDDEPSVTEALRRLLYLEGYTVLTAESAAEGFEILATNVVGVVISDHRMPVMHGCEFLSRVKILYPEVVRILLSGHADQEILTEAINQGSVFKFLTKPLNVERIREILSEAFLTHHTLRKDRN